MSSKLLKRLQVKQKEVEKSVKKKLNPNSSFDSLTDSEIALVLAYRAKNLRVHKKVKQSEFSKSANLSSSSTYANFEQKGTVSLVNFIKILRGFGRLYELERLLKPTVAENIKSIEKDIKSRVR